MIHNNWRRIANTIILSVLIFSLIITPNDSLHLKLVSFILILLFNGDVILKALMGKNYYLITFFSIVFPFILLVISVIISGEVLVSFKNIYFMLYILVIPIVIAFRINYQKIVISVLMFLALLVTGASFLDMLGILPLQDNPLLFYLYVAGEGNVGFWRSATFQYVVFLKGTPLLIILVAYATYKKKYLVLMLTILAMAFTGTRANLYVSILVMFACYLLDFKLTYGKVLTVVLAVAIILLGWDIIINFVVDIQAEKDITDEIKYGHVDSIIDVMTSDPLYLITGLGLGSSFYSVGASAYVNLTELSFLEVFRQTGVVGFLLFMYFIFKPVLTVWKNKSSRWVVVSYMGYLVIAFTNPLLFSSTPFIIYILVYLHYMALKMGKPELCVVA